MNRYIVVVEELHEYRITVEADNQRAAEDELWAAFDDGATPSDFTPAYDAEIQSVHARKPYLHEIEAGIR